MKTAKKGATQALGVTEKIEAERPLPPLMGSVRSSGSISVKDYYTPAEVDRLDSAALDNPHTVKTIINSMKKWR